MTKEEKENQLHELHLYVAERLTSIRTYANSLNNAEDSMKTQITLKKIRDCSQEVENAYHAIEELECEPTYDYEAEDNKLTSGLLSEF